ncbi:hypothetical protein N7454_010004 [Penicillium verhagenii]|nr:hypothetical protein N7454_010004 [Penicillium verhagenii]
MARVPIAGRLRDGIQGTTASPTADPVLLVVVRMWISREAMRTRPQQAVVASKKPAVRRNVSI